VGRYCGQSVPIRLASRDCELGTNSEPTGSGDRTTSLHAVFQCGIQSGGCVTRTQRQEDGELTEPANAGYGFAAPDLRRSGKDDEDKTELVGSVRGSGFRGETRAPKGVSTPRDCPALPVGLHRHHGWRCRHSSGLPRAGV